MNKIISNEIDCLLAEIVKTKLLEEKQSHAMPLVDDLFKRRLTEIYMRECEVALKPMLRNMISRGEAVTAIREHFGMETDGKKS